MKKRLLQSLLLMLWCLPVMSYAQVFEIDNFDSLSTRYTVSIEGKSKMVNVIDQTDKHEGTGAIKVTATVDSAHPWGSYAQLIYSVPKDVAPFDWSGSDSLSIWIKVHQAPALPENMVFRIHLADRPNADVSNEEYIFEETVVLDKADGWVNLRVPLIERPTDGSITPNNEGFVLFPKSWGGGTYNNEKLDRDKIVGFNLGIITTGYVAPRNLPMDSIIVSYDNFTRFGYRSVPFVVFNGKVVTGDLTMGGWGGSVTIDPNTGSAPGKSSIKWSGGGGWSGMYFDFAEKNMAGNWITNDTLKMKVKVPAEFGDDIRIQFMSNTQAGTDAAIKYVAKAADYNWDGTWKTIRIPLRNWVVSDGKAGFDSSKVKKFEILTENGSSKACDIYMDDIWTGNPVFDVVAPNKPDGVMVSASTNSNLISWTDVPGETKEVYDVYYSKTPITDVKASDVEVVKKGIGENVSVIEHLLRAPVSDQPVTYYYAIVCTDAFGNASEIAAPAGAVTNTALGVPTISLNPPATAFAADGDLKEWSAITPITVARSLGTGFVAPNTLINDDADCSAKVYLGIDNENLYVAYDVEDDMITVNPANTDDYKNDCADLYIGLYDWRGVPHSGYGRGIAPDYHARFSKDKARFDGQSLDTLLLPGANYSWTEKFPTGYVVEARIPLADFARKRNSGASNFDSLFVPANGMRIPIDISLNDADATGEREGILSYSPFNDDKSYQDVWRWLYTWIGDQWTVGVNDKPMVATTYALDQNYPNPFNPSTQIKYSLGQAGLVTLKVYDVLGREVASLVNMQQDAGSHTVSFNASHLASGIYLYQIKAGDFQSVKKMMLIK